MLDLKFHFSMFDGGVANWGFRFQEECGSPSSSGVSCDSSENLNGT